MVGTGYEIGLRSVRKWTVEDYTDIELAAHSINRKILLLVSGKSRADDRGKNTVHFAKARDQWFGNW